MALQGRTTARYRDTFFVSSIVGDNVGVFQALVGELTALLAMPVKLEKVDCHVRFLELRLKLAAGAPVHVTVAFRTDDDRQGEDHSVTSWPPPNDPRASLVLPSLLQGLASKIRHYHVPRTRGYTAAIRRATAFVRSRGYPLKGWVRSWALALVRQGAIVHCLPLLLRKVLHGCMGSIPAIRQSQ